MANQTYQLVVSGNLAGQFVQNVFHYRMDDDSFANRLLAAKGLSDGFIAATCDELFLDMCPFPYEMLSLKTRCITGGGGPEYIDLSVSGQNGTRTGTVQTSSSGPVILWHTDGPNRSTGKTFIPGISASDAEGGEISAAAKTAILAAAVDFLQPFTAVGGGTPECRLCIPKANDPTTRYLVDAAMIAKDIGKQRRRQLPV